MKIEAQKTFAGLISMKKGQIRELPQGAALSDLLRCGYVREIPEEAANSDPPSEEAVTDEDKRGNARKRKALSES